MTHAPPTAEQQLAFLRQLQGLLDEGSFVASYKYALLHALADLCVLQGDDSGAPLTLATGDIADQFVRLYWRQAVPFPGAALEGPLKQNTGRQANVLRVVRESVETHLYLTDYRSLYVGTLGEVTADDVLAEEGEAEHAPSYYGGIEADFWFRLWDVRRLVADDTPGVIEALRRLGNTRYHGGPVSLYGGMVERPLIVTRDDGAHWFADRDLFTGGRLWAERDADLRADTGRLAHELPVRADSRGRRLPGSVRAAAGRP